MNMPEGYKIIPGLEMKAQKIKQNKDVSGIDKVIEFKQYLSDVHGIGSGQGGMEKEIKRVDEIARFL